MLLDKNNRIWNGVDMEEERLAKICLVHVPGLTSKHIRRLKHSFGSFTKAWCATPTELEESALSGKLIKIFLRARAKLDPTSILHELTKYNIRVVLPEDQDFPYLLKQSHDPPEALFVRGLLSPAPAVAIVGTRKATKYGEHAVNEIVAPLARAGISIVSGLALGIDGLAHRAALSAGGRTLAFLATGIDDPSIYPQEHAALSQEILEKGGALVSESPPKTPGLKHLFPARNRLIASFTLATIVVEGALESGSLITAKLALEENREVLAVPGPIWSHVSEGTNHLLKLGAKVCTRAQDVLDALAIDRPDLVSQARSALPATPQEEEILSYLSQPTHIDTLSTLAKVTVSHVSSQLSFLEIKGLARHLGGQMWVRTK